MGKLFSAFTVIMVIAKIANGQNPSGNNTLGNSGVTSIASTTSNSYKLSVNGAIKQYGTGLNLVTSPTLFLQNTAANGRHFGINSGINTDNNGFFQIVDVTASNAARFVINNSGNIGIGTNLPSALFHTNGTVRFQSLGSQISYSRLLAVDDDGNLAYRDVSTLGGGGITLNPTEIAFGNASSQVSSSSDFTWNGSRLMLGNFNPAEIPTPVSINTGATFGSNTPGASGNLKLKLFDDNIGNVYGLGISGGVMEYQVPTGADHRFYGAGTEIMRLANTGNVGIGTSNPTSKFHVNGTVRFESLQNNDLWNKVLVTDDDGNLRWRAASTLSGGGGSGSYIDNQNTAAQNASLWISGSGKFGAGIESWRGDNSNVAIGQTALNAISSGTNNVAIGYLSLPNATTGSNIAIGSYSSFNVITGTQNVNIGGGGLSAGANFNVGVGSATLGAASGQFNAALGQQALANLSTGSNNIGIGYFAGGSVSTGNNNVNIGTQAGVSSNGSGNVFVGHLAGYDNTGSGNVFLGYLAGRYETGSNKLYIDNTETATPLVYGDFGSNLLRVNGQLNVTGSAKFDGLGATPNNGLTKILAADNDGNILWRDASTLGGGGANFWIQTGSNIHYNTGNVGIGTINPVTPLHIVGQDATVRLEATSASGYGGHNLYDNSGNLAASMQYGNPSALAFPATFFLGTRKAGEPLVFITGGETERMRIDGNGNVGVGTNNTQGYKFAVNGDAIFTKVKVKQFSTWPDYVFHSPYELMPLIDLEKYIQKNKHLPGVPSAKEVDDNGLDLGDNQSLLLKKIEELTLYIIDINKKVEKLSEENAELRKKLVPKK